jgi:hypothetical protein
VKEKERKRKKEKERKTEKEREINKGREKERKKERKKFLKLLFFNKLNIFKCKFVEMQFSHFPTYRMTLRHLVESQLVK